MRVNETAAARRTPASAEAGRFADALRRARTAQATARTTDLGSTARARPIEARKAAVRGGAAAVARREAARDEERGLPGAAADAARELRTDPSPAAGIEVVLRPEPRLLRAAEAELPRVVEALRLRGVEVARAEVRPRQGGRRA